MYILIFLKVKIVIFENETVNISNIIIVAIHSVGHVIDRSIRRCRTFSFKLFENRRKVLTLLEVTLFLYPYCFFLNYRLNNI